MQPVKKDIHSVRSENDKEDQHPDEILIFNIGYSIGW